MYTTTLEPHQLIARLEKKFERKVRVAHERKQARDLRASLQGFRGTSVQNFWREYHNLDLA